MRPRRARSCHVMPACSHPYPARMRCLLTARLLSHSLPPTPTHSPPSHHTTTLTPPHAACP
ncbi:hypothetical protein DENSPDRAFT_846282 [Dentipellis sp. KUC8613]|nr:hypothetical protein DENSPDRAFT_846282 [Dentipellis sp. KUC8613]